MRARAFSVDIAGLLEALTQQFPEPLLCVRELVQNAADAGARKIQVEASFDPKRGLLRLSVHDDGRGMGTQEVEGYLTIGFSRKGQDQRGRFGIGKLSPYALGIQRMTVETSDGRERHRLTFGRDGAGKVAKHQPAGPPGTEVRIYKSCDRVEAESLAERTFDLVREHCGGLSLQLLVNGTSVAQTSSDPSRYSWMFTLPTGGGSLTIAAEPKYRLLSGGILLESGSPLLGDAIGYALDSSDLAPTLSRNAVRRDQAFEALVRAAQAQVVHLVTAVVDQLERRVGRLRQHAIAVERELDPDDRAAVEWLRARVMEPEVQPDPRLRRAPVFETADGDLVSVEDLERTRGGRLPVSRVPRTREELFGYVDRGVPVLLLYRDVEDFLDRLDLETVEVDGLDLGREVETSRYSVGEAALVRRRPLRPVKRRRTWVLASGFSVAAAVGIALAIAWPTAPAELPAAGPTPGAGPWQQAHVVPPGPRDFWLPRFVALGVAVMSLGMAVGLAYHFLTRTGRPSLAVDPARPRVKKRKRRVRVWTQAILHPIDFMVARLWSQSGRAEPAPAVEGYRELAPEHMVRNGVRLDLDAVPLGFVDLRGARGAEHEGRVLVVRERRVLLNRNHPTIRDLTRLAEVDPLRSRILLECLLGTDPDLARETDPRQVEWDLLSRAQAWVATGRRAHGADGDG